VARTKDPIFLGVTKGPSRQFLALALGHTLKARPKLVVPAVGQFNLVLSAIVAGYERENITVSDVSLFSALVGSLLREDNPKPSYVITPEFEALYETLTLDRERGDVRVAFVLWLMKRTQLAKLHYRNAEVEDLDAHFQVHVERLLTQVEAMVKRYAGIRYEHEDLRDAVAKEYDDQTVVVINPPLYSDDKIFDFEDVIEYDAGVEPLDMNKNFTRLYELSQISEAAFFWYREKSVENFKDEDIIYSIEEKPHTVTHWLCTRPAVLDGFIHKYGVKSFARKNVRPLDARIWGATDVMTADSDVRVITTTPEVAYYYRDLFAHRLGVPSGNEWYGLILIDGKVFGMLMFMMSPVMRLVDEYAFLNSGFTVPSDVYPRTSRLLNLLITSQAFAPHLRALARQNRYWKIRGIKTTIFSRYRKSKATNGIYTVDHREVQPDGNYKLRMVADFRDDTFKDVVERFIREEEAFVEERRTKA